jgi:transaldolase
MEILIDSAELEAIRQAFASGFVGGVTTNPTLLRRAGVRAAQVPDLVREALILGAREVHLQTYASDAEGMFSEGQALAALAPGRICVKLVATPAGYSAAARLTSVGVRVTLTAVYTLRQALLSQSVGASYIAVYLGRMRDAGIDALALVGQMQALLRAHAAGVTILAASIRDPEEVAALGALGIGAATLAPSVLARLLDSDDTARAAEGFTSDARTLVE